MTESDRGQCYIDENKIIRNRQTIDIPKESNFFCGFEKKFKTYNDKVALVDTDNNLQCTFNDIMVYSKRIAGFLHRHGVTDGDLMAMNVRNCYNYFYPLFAAMRQNVAIATFNEYATVYEANNMLKDNNTKILFTNADQLAKSKEAIKGTNVQLIVTFEKCDDTGVVYLGDILANSEYDLDMTPQNPQSDLVFIYYSSGSTGKPKGVMMTIDNLCASRAQFEAACGGWDDQSRVMALVIFAHISTIVAVIYPLYVGSTIVLVNDGMHDGEKVLTSIKKHKITHSMILSPLCAFLASSPTVADYDLTSLKELVFVGSTVAPNIVQVLTDMFPRFFMRQAFGMTELCGYGIVQPRELNKAGSAGIPVPAFDVKVVGLETGEAVEAYKHGELYVRGQNVFSGYLNNPEATKENITSDGWLRTGDIGYYDDDLHFFIVDRIKMVIKLEDGVPLYPGQVEGVLLTHASVLECCVVGKPMEMYEIPVAFVVLTPSYAPDARALHDLVKEKLSAYKALTGGIKFLEKLPKLPNGKIDRGELKKLLKSQKK